MEYITFMSGYAVFAVLMMMSGFAYKFSRTLWNRATMKREMNKRASSFYPVVKMPLLQALWRMNITPFTRFWMRANPPTFVAHLIYHIAVGTAIFSYTLSMITLLMIGKLPIIDMPISETLAYVFDWFSKFHSEGYALLGSAVFTEVYIIIFQIALLLGITAEAITITLSKLHMRGMIRPIDLPTKMAGIRAQGLPRSTRGGWERKAIGLMVLGIVVPLFLQFQGLMDEHHAFYIHGTVALTFMAIFPFTSLFHEVARWRMWGGAMRMVDRRTA